MAEAEVKRLASYDLNLFADYFQLYLQGEEADGDQPDDWVEQLVANMIAIDSGIVGIGTARNMTVPVHVDLLDGRPDDDFAAWDHVAEASLDVPSGQIVIAGFMDYFPEAMRMPVTPGSYRVRVYASGLGSLSADGLCGDDRYHIVVWPEEYSAPKVLKKWPAL